MLVKAYSGLLLFPFTCCKANRTANDNPVNVVIVVKWSGVTLAQPVVNSFSQATRLIWTLHLHAVAFLVFTRHSLVRAKGEVFVLLLLFCSFFCQRFLHNPQANSRQILHASVLWFRMCLLPFWGLAAPAGGKRGNEIFVTVLWESMENFCILAVFERYLSNACTDPHQILFV